MFPSPICLAPLRPLPAGDLAAPIRLLRAQYLREIPPHYRANPRTRPVVDINVLLVDGGSLFAPASPRTSFIDFYRELSFEHIDLFRYFLSPSGVVKAATANHPTPIKEIAQMRLADLTLPGDAELYGWGPLAEEAHSRGLSLQVLFQGNGLYFNRGSAIYDGRDLLAYPDFFLAELLDAGAPFEVRQRLAADEESLKRPLLWFVTGADGRMSAHVHTFLPGETYVEGMRRLEADLRASGARAGLAASPPLILPSADGAPIYLTLEEILGQYHANDVRHALYCPYKVTMLLFPELSRAQCLTPARLVRSLSGRQEDRVFLHLSETLDFMSSDVLARELDNHGYRGRYMRGGGAGVKNLLWINPLEGIYSFLVPFLTRSGQFGLVQTSGTRANVTGNDGPTIRQLIAILRDLNTQPPFADDPIIAAASGSQGNDVPNIVCRSADKAPGLLAALLPAAALDDTPVLRGPVTTPRVGIAIRRS